MDKKSQAGGPEVVAWRRPSLHGATFTERWQDVEAWKMLDDFYDELITLQSHREAMATQSTTLTDLYLAALAEYRENIAKKDAALKACALPESYVSSTFASDPTGGASILFCFSDTKDAEEWHAVITQAQEAQQ